MKLDDYECRERSNGRMIDHLNKTISKNKERIRTAKKRYKELNDEMSKMKKKVIESDEVVVNGSKKKKKKKDGSSKKGTNEADINYGILDSSDDDDDNSEDEQNDEIEKQCNVELHFDCTSSRTSSGSSTQTNGTDEVLVVGKGVEDEDSE